MANSRGVCVLDLTKGKNTIQQTKVNGSFEDSNMACDLPTSCSNGIRSDMGPSAKMRNNQAKWKMLTESEERQFSVQAMTWWERNGIDGSSEDLLFSAIQYAQPLSNRDLNAGQNQSYLVCWSRRR